MNNQQKCNTIILSNMYKTNCTNNNKNRNNNNNNKTENERDMKL